ncbi:MAG: tetratricopeptide repeat protein, partial [Terriglobales bacterium]
MIAVARDAGAGTPKSEAVQQQLARIANSATFRGAGRLRRFLEFTVNEALSPRRDQIKEYVVGLAVFDKPESFDTRTDPIVRVQARRLRALLERYYREEGANAELLIELPKGGYAPVFGERAAGPERISLAVALATRNTVAVQPFEDHSRGAELAYFCKSLRREVVCALAQQKDIRTLD